MRPTIDRCYSPAITAMNNLLWSRYEQARQQYLMSLVISDRVWEARAAARTALNTWYTFASHYNRFRTAKAFYWPHEAERSADIRT